MCAQRLKGTELKTVIIIEITHEKPLPAKIQDTLTDTIASRVYGYLYAQGAQVGVTAKVEDKAKSE